jgi:hypothetical protein
MLHKLGKAIVTLLGIMAIAITLTVPSFWLAWKLATWFGVTQFASIIAIFIMVCFVFVFIEVTRKENK